MNEQGMNLIISLKESLGNKFEKVILIGSFLKTSWNPDKSDIDLIIIDPSFDFYSHVQNLKYIRSLLVDINYEVDIFLYTPLQFHYKLTRDQIFKQNVGEGLVL